MLFASAAVAAPTAALVCGITPQSSGIIERTIVGQRPIGGDYDTVVIGRTIGMGRTDADGYREAKVSVLAVLRGSARPRINVRFPAAAGEVKPFLAVGHLYLLALTSLDVGKSYEAGPCSATQEVESPEAALAALALASQPEVYDEELASLYAENSTPPATIPLGPLAITAVVGIALVCWLVALTVGSTNRLRG